MISGGNVVRRIKTEEAVRISERMRSVELPSCGHGYHYNTQMIAARSGKMYQLEWA